MKKGLVILVATIVACAVGLYALSWSANHGAFFSTTDVWEEVYEPLADADGVMSKMAAQHRGYEAEYGLVMLYALALAGAVTHVTRRLSDHFGKAPIIAGIFEVNADTDSEGHPSIVFIGDGCYGEGC